jgi:hypothetical protein
MMIANSSPPVAVGKVGAADHPVAESAAQAAQDLVAGEVTVGVVANLEVVDVHQRRAERQPSSTSRALELLRLPMMSASRQTMPVRKAWFSRWYGKWNSMLLKT